MNLTLLKNAAIVAAVIMAVVYIDNMTGKKVSGILASAA